MIKSILQNQILKNFFNIDLSSRERAIALDSVSNKYRPAIANSILLSFLSLPAVFLLDVGIVVNVLIPITMVSGTAWFSVSLANVKKKFENFGNELTFDMFESFVTSLLLLLLLAVSALIGKHFPFLTQVANNDLVNIIAGILGIIVVGRLIFKIFIGALKYDINDAMLAGQTEVAERFFKRSLSFLHSSADILRSGKPLEVANYHIGNSFYEIFS